MEKSLINAGYQPIENLDSTYKGLKKYEQTVKRSIFESSDFNFCKVFALDLSQNDIPAISVIVIAKQNQQDEFQVIDCYLYTFDLSHIRSNLQMNAISEAYQIHSAKLNELGISVIVEDFFDTDDDNTCVC